MARVAMTYEERRDQEMLETLDAAVQSARKAWELSAAAYKSAAKCTTGKLDQAAPRRRQVTIANCTSETTRALEKVFKDLHKARHVHREFMKAAGLYKEQPEER